MELGRLGRRCGIVIAIIIIIRISIVDTAARRRRSATRGRRRGVHRRGVRRRGVRRRHGIFNLLVKCSFNAREKLVNSS
jgi:hypothetical protein